MSYQTRGILGGDPSGDQESELIREITLGQFLMPQSRPTWARQHEIEIQILKQQLEEKDLEITELRKKLKEVEGKNNDLQIKLHTKDLEVSELQERIQTLEDEKKVLQDELSRVETKLKRLEDDMKMLSKSSKSHEEENRKLREDLQKVEYSLKTTEQNLNSDNEKLRKEVKQLKETRALPPVEQPRLPIQPSEQSMALLHLGELCWQIQGTMYEKVLPKYYTPVRSYKVKNIEKDVKRLVKSEEERDAAKERWEKLKSKLNWSDDMEETIRSLQESRNLEAHPRISETTLKKYATVLEKDGFLKGWLSHERVVELIDIWKRLAIEDS